VDQEEEEERGRGGEGRKGRGKRWTGREGGKKVKYLGK
tara:strand:+ start:995 stop:1108 length:114 start_codon:yes stop_codon:yes gene_type:complete